MQRCAAYCALALAAALPWAAQAQMPTRPFPANALRGSLQVTQPPEILLNGQSARLSPGSRIRGADNMVHLSGGLIGQQMLVHYTIDPTGNVHQVWVLRPEEAAKKPWPRTPEQAQRWAFDPSAQTWTER